MCMQDLRLYCSTPFSASRVLKTRAVYQDGSGLRNLNKVHELSKNNKHFYVLTSGAEAGDGRDESNKSLEERLADAQVSLVLRQVQEYVLVAVLVEVSDYWDCI